MGNSQEYVQVDVVYQKSSKDDNLFDNVVNVKCDSKWGIVTTLLIVEIRVYLIFGGGVAYPLTVVDEGG